MMIRNYTNVTFRNMIKYPAYSFINITGLSVGLAAFILIAMWIQHELSYDRFHEKHGRIYRVVENQFYANNEVFPVAVTPGPLGPYLEETLPEVEHALRLTDAQFLFQHEDQSFNERGYMADPTFFQMFSFQLTRGNKETVLSKLENIAISEKLAEKYFPDSEPIGKVLRINNTDFSVSGVFADSPENSHLSEFDYILPFELYIKFGWDSLKRWGNNSYYTYVQLTKNASLENVNDKVRDIIKKNNPPSVTELYLQPLTEIHLYSDFTADIGGHGDIQYIYIFSAVAAFVLIIACINFMNLSTARSASRSKEVGVRKVVGAARRQLILQFLAESLAFVLLALIVALIIVQLLLPVFNEISGKFLSLSMDSSIVWIIVVVTLATGMISGSYPAFFMSSFKPVTTLKGTFRTGRSALIFRKILVVTQFTISILLISSTIIVYSQLDFIRNKRLGFEKDNTMMFRVNNTIRQNPNGFKDELLTISGVKAVTYASNNLTYVGNSSSGLEWEGKDPDHNILVHTLAVDYDFIKAFNVELIEGRDFSSDLLTDSSAIILNEEAIRQMGIKDPVNKKVTWGDELTIIGIVKDFHFKPIHTRIEPLALFVSTSWYNRVYVRMQPENVSEHVAAVEGVFKKFCPENPFEFTFLDDEFDRLYRAEQRTGTIFNYFAVIAVFISCLGLVGLVMFTTEQRTKEIGIRKVLGASVGNLFRLISIDFIRLIILSNILAVPVAWYIMDKWLSGFAYHIDIHWLTFGIAALSSIIIAWLTMSFQSVRAATANPINSLRTE